MTLEKSKEEEAKDSLGFWQIPVGLALPFKFEFVAIHMQFNWRSAARDDVHYESR